MTLNQLPGRRGSRSPPRDAQVEKGPPEHVIEIRVEALSELFDAMDPGPPHEKDLDPRAEAFVVAAAKESPRHAPLRLVVRLDRSAGLPDEQAILRKAIQVHFRRCAQSARRELRELFHNGRISLVIGLGVLAAAFTGRELAWSTEAFGRLGELIAESFVIGGWVAMWRPIETFLYDWWPIRARAALFDRLASAAVQVVYADATVANSAAWRSDWPVARQTVGPVAVEQTGGGAGQGERTAINES